MNQQSADRSLSTIPFKVSVISVWCSIVLLVLAAFGGTLMVVTSATAAGGTIDSVYRYAWGENVGWIDFGASADPVMVTDSGLSGSAYGENIGWIILDPIGFGGVQNDGTGNLSGYAWGENVGWIDFSQVSIGEDGVFAGQAYGENIGWITFGTGYNRVQVNWAGHSTIADHDDTQVKNAFTFQNKTNEPLFAFKLIPESGTATVTELVISLTGAQKIDVSRFSNLRLYRDHDNDAAYDASDEAVGGAGVMTLSGQSGSLTFSGDWLATTTENFVVIADWNAPENGSFLTFDLLPEGVTMVEDNGQQDIFGSVDHVQHGRNNRGGGSAIGTPAPAGRSIETGGSPDGGEMIGDNPDFKWPAAHAGPWSDGQNSYDRADGTYASTATVGATSTYANFGYNVPASNSVQGITVQLEAAAVAAGGTIDLALSWDGGTSWTAAKTTPTLTTADQVIVLGSNSDAWGRSWSPADFTNANFRVRFTGTPSGGNTLYVDALRVKVYHIATGGGQDGGGPI